MCGLGGRSDLLVGLRIVFGRHLRIVFVPIPFGRYRPCRDWYIFEGIELDDL